jgi:hypothetical protein
MPVHDWTRVGAGTFHHFHSAWITHLTEALNDGRLPPDYYAMAEQIAGGRGPDVLTLQTAGTPGEAATTEGPRGAVAVAVAPPKVRFTATAEINQYALRKRRIVVRHSSGDRVIAFIEILSQGNKNSRYALRSFVHKAVSALTHGIHLLLVDLLPPGPRDPQGIHGAVWAELGETYHAPADKPLTLAAYSAGIPKTAYVEPIAVGDVLPDMPLFLTPDDYIPVGLEATYQAAWRGVPKRWRDELEAPTTPDQDAGAS